MRLDDSSAAPLPSQAKADKQEDDVIVDGRGAQSKRAASAGPVEGSCGPIVLRKLLRK